MSDRKTGSIGSSDVITVMTLFICNDILKVRSIWRTFVAIFNGSITSRIAARNMHGDMTSSVVVDVFYFRARSVGGE